MKLEFSRDAFEKYPNAKFNENPSSGSRVVPCGRTDGRMDGQMDRHTKEIVDFRNSSNSHRNFLHKCLCFVKVDCISDFSRNQCNYIVGYCGGIRVYPYRFIVMKIIFFLFTMCFVTLTVVHWPFACICFLLFLWWWWSYKWNLCIFTELVRLYLSVCDQPRGLMVPGSIPGSTVGIFPEREDSRGDHGLGRLVEYMFKGPPSTTSSHTHPHTTHIIGTT